MHTTTQRYTVSEKQVKLYRELKSRHCLRGSLHNYTLWQKIYFMCSGLSSIPNFSDYSDKQALQASKNAEFIGHKDVPLNKDNCLRFTPVNFLFALKNNIEIKLNGEGVERNLYFGDKIYLKTYPGLLDFNDPGILQTFKIPTLIKTDDNALYIYGEGPDGPRYVSMCNIRDNEELLGKFISEKGYIQEGDLSLRTWEILWDLLKQYHKPYKQKHNLGEPYVNVLCQREIVRVTKDFLKNPADYTNENFNEYRRYITMYDQEGYTFTENFKFLDAILRVKDVQNSALALFNEKDIASRIYLEKTFKQITMCGGFAAYTMEELYCWRQHLDDVIRKLTNAIMGGKGEPDREIWKSVLKEHKKGNYLTAYDQIIATIETMKKQIEYAMCLNKQEYGKNLNNRYPVIVTLLKKLHEKQLLSPKKFEQILEKAKESFNAENTHFPKENRSQYLGKKFPQLVGQFGLTKKIFGEDETWKQFKQNVTQIFTGKINHETERRKLLDKLEEHRWPDIKKHKRILKNIESVKNKIKNLSDSSASVTLKESKIEEIKSNCKKHLLKFTKQLKKFKQQRKQKQTRYLQSLSTQDLEKRSFNKVLSALLTSPYSNEELSKNTPNNPDEVYSASVYNDFFGVLRFSSPSQPNRITWQDYFYENKDGKGSELLDKICKQTGKIQDIAAMLEPIINDTCHTVESLRNCFSFFISYFIQYHRNHLYDIRVFTRNMGSFLNVFDATEVKTGIFTSHMQLKYKDKYKRADIFELLSAVYDAAINMPKNKLGSYDNLTHRVLAIVVLFYTHLSKRIKKDKDRMKQLLTNMQEKTASLKNVSEGLNQQISSLIKFEKVEMSELQKIGNEIDELAKTYQTNGGKVQDVFDKWIKLSNDQSSYVEKMNDFKDVLNEDRKKMSALYSQMEKFAETRMEREKELYKIALDVWKYLQERIKCLDNSIEDNNKKLAQFQEEIKLQDSSNHQDGSENDIKLLAQKILDASQVSEEIDRLTKELTKVRKLCRRLKGICDNETIIEAVETQFNELKQKSSNLKVSLKETKDKLNEEIKKIGDKLGAKTRELTKISGEFKFDDIENKFGDLKKHVGKMKEYKSRKIKFIEEMRTTGKQIQELANGLNNDVKAAQYVNHEDIGLDLSNLSGEYRNKVLAVHEVIKNYLSLTSGKGSPYFKKSAGDKAKQLTIKLKTFMENYSTQKKNSLTLAWNKVEQEISRHRNPISSFFAKIFKLKTKSQKIYNKKFDELQNLSATSNGQNSINRIFDQNEELLTTFVKQGAANGLNEVTQLTKKIELLFSRIEKVKEIIGFLSKDVDRYLTFVEGQNDIIKDLTEPKFVMEHLGEAFKNLCKIFNLNVQNLFGAKINEGKKLVNKRCTNKTEAVEYAKKWMRDIQKFLKGQEYKLNSYEKTLKSAQNKVEWFSNKVKSAKSGKSFLNEGLRLRYKLHKMEESYRKRMGRTEKIFSLACDLYKGQLDKTLDFMTQVGNGNHENHKQTREGLRLANKRLHESAKQLPKMGVYAVPQEQLNDLQKLLKEQKQENQNRLVEWLNNCFSENSLTMRLK